MSGLTDADEKKVVSVGPDYQRKVSFNVYLIVKRLIDFSVAAVSLMLLTPLMLLIGSIIKIVSPGPLFFRQPRVGYKGREFDVLKFRTMIVNAEQIARLMPEFSDAEKPVVTLKDDSRIFVFGNMLRKTSLDELPQLFNVLIGEMSLVGPRPLIADEVAACNDRQKRRLEARPGLTGWAQINGRHDVDFGDKMEMDLFYMQKRSFWFDVGIMLKTLYVVMSRRGAY